MTDGTTTKVTLTAGVDLGGTKIQTVILRGGAMAGQSRVETPTSGVDGVVEAIAETVRTALQDAKGAQEALGGVGIGTPGNVEDGAVSNAWNVPGFGDRVELGPLVSKSLGGVSVTLENDVRAAVLGERRRGAGRPYRDFLGVFVGTGVGGGLVLDGTLREGKGAAGEIGHTVVKDAGRKCRCGRRGCLEAYAGRGSMEATARRWADNGKSTILFDLMEKKGRDRLTSGVFATALEKNDEMAKRLVDEAVWALGLALASAQNLLDLEAIVIGGGLGDRLGRPFVDRVADAMKPHLFVPDHAPVMLTTELGDLSGAVGAAVRAGG